MLLREAAAVWSAGLQIGLATIRREPVLGLKRIALPTSYWRTAEFAYVFRQLRLQQGARVLDLGSPKDLAGMLARGRGYHVVATDFLEEAVEVSERYARAQGISGDGAGQVRSEVQDGRALTYGDDEFDAAFSVSVLEHIPDEGDAVAMRELVRVVRPGGAIIVTVPFAQSYRETFVPAALCPWAGDAAGDVFWERHYDEAELKRRLLEVPGLECEHRENWGERWFGVEAALNRAGRARALLSPLEGLLAAVALVRVDDSGRADTALAAFLTLRRTPLRAVIGITA